MNGRRKADAENGQQEPEAASIRMKLASVRMNSSVNY